MMMDADTGKIRPVNRLGFAACVALALLAGGLFSNSSAPGIPGGPSFLPGTGSASARALSIPKPRPPEARPGNGATVEGGCSCWKKKRKRPR